jgi:hypothetical protein
VSPPWGKPLACPPPHPPATKPVAPQSSHTSPKNPVNLDILSILSKLEAMNEQQLAQVFEWFLQLELEQAVRELGEGIVSDEDAGRIPPAAIASSIREFRRKHPFSFQGSEGESQGALG